MAFYGQVKNSKDKISGEETEMMGLSGKSKRLGWITCLWGVGVLSVVGCGSGGYHGPTGAVTGRVTLDGKPIPQGSIVSFVSEAGFTATATVSGNGSYQLQTAGNPEIPVSTYKVSIVPPAQAMSETDYDKYMSGEGAGEEVDATEAPSEVIPPQYADPATSGLSFDVEQGANTINIELE
jgi:hypothetical protein